MFCTSCGKQIPDESLFCEYCGARQEGVSPPTPPAQAPVQSPVQSPGQGSPVQIVSLGQSVPIAAAPVGGTAKKPMDPKAKAALIVIAAVAAVVVGAKLILGAMFTPEKTIEKFLTAYQTGDADGFRAVTAVVEDRLELTDEVLAHFFAFCAGSEKDRFVGGLRETLMRDALYLEQGAEARGNGLVRLTEQSHVLFSTYAVELTPVSVQIASEFENTRVEVGGETYTAGSGETRADLLPGVYAVTASYTAPNTGVTLEKTIPDCRVSSPAAYVADSDRVSAVPGAYIDIYFDYTTAYMEGNSALTVKEVQIDGKPYTGDLSGMDLYSGFSIGPVNSDSKIKVVSEAGGMEFEQEFDLKESGGYCYIYPELSDTMRAELINIAAAVAPDWIRAFNAYDREALQRLNTSGSVAPGLLTDLDDYISQAWNSAEYVIYFKLDQIKPQQTGASVYFGMDPVFYANVEIPVVLNGSSGAMSLATGEYEKYDPMEDYWVTAYVSMVYVDGEWQVDNLYWL